MVSLRLVHRPVLETRELSGVVTAHGGYASKWGSGCTSEQVLRSGVQPVTNGFWQYAVVKKTAYEKE